MDICPTRPLPGVPALQKKPFCLPYSNVFFEEKNAVYVQRFWQKVKLWSPTRRMTEHIVMSVESRVEMNRNERSWWITLYITNEITETKIIFIYHTHFRSALCAHICLMYGSSDWVFEKFIKYWWAVGSSVSEVTADPCQQRASFLYRIVSCIFLVELSVLDCFQFSPILRHSLWIHWGRWVVINPQQIEWKYTHTHHVWLLNDTHNKAGHSPF